MFICFKSCFVYLLTKTVPNRYPKRSFSKYFFIGSKLKYAKQTATNKPTTNVKSMDGVAINAAITEIVEIATPTTANNSLNLSTMLIFMSSNLFYPFNCFIIVPLLSLKNRSASKSSNRFLKKSTESGLFFSASLTASNSSCIFFFGMKLCLHK